MLVRFAIDGDSGVHVEELVYGLARELLGRAVEPWKSQQRQGPRSWVGIVDFNDRPKRFVEGVRLMKAHLAERGVRVIAVVIGHEDVTFDVLSELPGLWVAAETPSRILSEVVELGAKRVNRMWWVLPFKEQPEKPDDDLVSGDYEEYSPKLAMSFGLHANGSPQGVVGVTTGLRVVLPRESRLTETIETVYRRSLSQNERLGGSNVLLTTLLQMNDRLELVNNYSERLQEEFRMDLFALPAMQLNIVDEREETDIANLVTAGLLEVSDVTLGDE